MEIIGMAEVKWTENRGTGNQRRARTFKESVKYLGMDYDFVRNSKLYSIVSSSCPSRK
jgi:hypothetical protein